MFSKQTEILIVGNYLPDEQESMQRFARMLDEGLRAADVGVEWVKPGTWFGKLRAGSTGLGKWLAYVDKYPDFPVGAAAEGARAGGGCGGCRLLITPTPCTCPRHGARDTGCW